MEQSETCAQVAEFREEKKSVGELGSLHFSSTNGLCVLSFLICVIFITPLTYLTDYHRSGKLTDREAKHRVQDAGRTISQHASEIICKANC